MADDKNKDVQRKASKDQVDQASKNNQSGNKPSQLLGANYGQQPLVGQTYGQPLLGSAVSYGQPLIGSTYGAPLRRSITPATTYVQPATTVLSQPAVTSNLRQSIRGESTYEQIPYEKTIIEYVEQKIVEYVPVETKVTDYYAVEHIVEYIPHTTYETEIEYVPVERVHERVDYQTVTRQVVHQPQATQQVSTQVVQQPVQTYTTQVVQQPVQTYATQSYATQSYVQPTTVVSQPTTVLSQPVRQSQYVSQPFVSGVSRPSTQLLSNPLLQQQNIRLTDSISLAGKK